MSVLCLASLGLFQIDGRHTTAREGILPNLDFSQGGKHWSGTPDGVLLRGDPARVLELRNEARRQVQISQVLRDPSRYTNIRVAAEIMVEDVTPGRLWWERAGILLRGFDAQGARLTHWESEVVLLSGSKPWRRYETVIPVAADAHRLLLTVFLASRSGTMKVRNLRVDSLEEAVWFKLAKPALMLLWAGAGLWIVAPLIIRERARITAWLALAALIATLVGVLSPQPQLSNTGKSALAMLSRLTAPPTEHAAPAQRPDRKHETARKPETAFGGAETLLSAFPHGGGAYAAHFGAHGVLAFLVFLAFRERSWRQVIAYLLLTAAATEVLQVFAVTRTVGLADGLWNGVGIAGGFAAYLVLRTVSRRLRRYSST